MDATTIKSIAVPENSSLPRKLNVGVVGIGRMGQRHAIHILQRVSRANLLCVCSPAPQDLAWADEHLKPHGVRIFDSFEEMIQTCGLQAVIIASATALHMEHTLAALNSGIHVLCEKPVCTNVEELRSLVTRMDSQSHGPTLMVGFVRRFDADYLDAYAKVRAGAIGRPIIIRSHQSEKLDTSQYYKQYLKSSGGIFIDSIIHDIDLALFFLGEDAVPKSVSAVGVAAIHEQLAADGDVDNAVGICEFWDGKIAYFHNSRTAAHGYDSSTEIYGTAGKLSVNLVPRRNRVEICDGDRYVKIEPLPGWYERYQDSFVTEASMWVDAVLDGKPMPVPIESCLMSLVIATALQESLRTGETIRFGRNGVRIQYSDSLKPML